MPNPTDLARSPPAGAGDDEYDDIVELLREHCVAADASGISLCHAIARAAMGEAHLWQDMGLPHRTALNDLLRANFPALAAKNTNDMKWKKFFYRQLCERAGVPMCRAPHCAECDDRALCFGPEEAG
jgi:nitrogen fixation protein NifQ